MYHFTADPRDGAIGNGCATCCCSPANARPGETNKWLINYAPWSFPLGGPGITEGTQFEIVQRDGCDPVAPTDPSISAPLLTTTPLNTALAGTLVAQVVNPGTSPSYSVVPFGGPEHGTLTVNSDGTFSYNPTVGYQGFDSFWWQVEINGKNYIGETVIGVGSAGMPTDAQVTPDVEVVPGSPSISQRLQQLTFAVAVSPAAKVGCAYRLSVKQRALDCDTYYTHLSCFDIRIVKC